MKKPIKGIREAYKKKTVGTTGKTETRISASVIRYRSTGGYRLLLSTGLHLLHSMSMSEYEAKEIAGKLGIEIQQWPPYVDRA
jgi:hypothetical protein